MIPQVITLFNLPPNAMVQPFGTGLINNTWKVSDNGKSYILQRINHNVFRQPEHIAANIDTLAKYLHQHSPDYWFIEPVKSTSNTTMINLPEHGYFRLFPFVNNSHTIDVTETPEQAREAAQQFGLFTKVLSGLPVNTLKTTLPHFHDLSRRFEQFNAARIKGNPERLQKAREEIAQVNTYAHIVKTYEQISCSPDFKLRVTHHDTKISNVLFNDNDQGLAVIDLDTVMPGYYISDVGDMMRTYLSPVSEEEKDFTKIEVRDLYFKAIVEGYLQPMKSELSKTEISSFVYSGLFLIYMQAVRFLTDHLNNDVYYGAAFEGHNLIRAQNQLVLLSRLLEKEALYNDIVQQVAKAPL